MRTEHYRRMTPLALKELAMPRSWGAASVPVLLGGVLVHAFEPAAFSWLTLLLLLISSILMQSAVNNFNHGYDFLKGTDSLENCPDPTDAPVVYHQLDPRQTIYIGFFYMFLALVVSLPIILRAGMMLFVLGTIGALVAYFYSAGPLPITHTPTGEVFTGIAMGGVIPLAVYYAMTSHLNFWIFWYASPIIIVIGMALMMNNICDIEKDALAKRSTLPILTGRPVATILLRGGYLLALLLIGGIGLMEFREGMWVYLPLVGVVYPRFKALFTMAFVAENRIDGIRAVMPLIPILGVFYVLLILLATFLQR